MTQCTDSSSNYKRIVYEAAVQRLLRFGESLATPSNQAAASAWITKFGRQMVASFHYSVLSGAECVQRKWSRFTGHSLGSSRQSSRRRGIFLDRVRTEMITFATAEWVDLAPDVVTGLEDTVRELQPGITLGAAFPPSPPPLSTPPGVGHSMHAYRNGNGIRPPSWVTVSVLVLTFRLSHHPNVW
jgi:hypothetical protein